MRVFSALLGTETNTFAPLPTGLAEFTGYGYDPTGQDGADIHPFSSPMRAARERGKKEGWTLFEGKNAFAQPGGLTTRAAYETLRDQLLDDLRRVLPVDMVLLGLHGAMVADGYDDAEGDLLARVREVVGPNVVVGAELDPHGHLTDLKVNSADVLVFFKEYPHIDMLERARELVDLCVRTARGEIKPVKSTFDLGMMCMYHTTREPMRGFVDRMMALEGQNGVLSVSLVHSFPWGDVPDFGTRMLVITDNRKAEGDALARRLGEEVIGFRDQLLPVYPQATDAITQALETNGAPVVLADSADNPGAGSAGDSTFILAEMIRRDVQDACLGTFWDPGAVALCFLAGEGARLNLRIGGKVSPQSGAPLDVEAEVVALKRSAFMSGFGGSKTDLGDTAVIRIGGIHVVMISHRTQALGRDLFTQFGLDLMQMKLIVVKSSQHFHAAFGPIAAKVIYVETPGSSPIDFTHLPFRKARTTIWPFRR